MNFFIWTKKLSIKFYYNNGNPKVILRKGKYVTQYSVAQATKGQFEVVVRSDNAKDASFEPNDNGGYTVALAGKLYNNGSNTLQTEHISLPQELQGQKVKVTVNVAGTAAGATYKMRVSCYAEDGSYQAPSTWKESGGAYDSYNMKGTSDGSSSCLSIKVQIRKYTSASTSAQKIPLTDISSASITIKKV